MTLIQTNKGPMSHQEVADYLEYARYKHHILGLKVKHETMARWYGELRANEFQARLRKEQEGK